jgi:hypothetical protein
MLNAFIGSQSEENKNDESVKAVHNKIKFRKNILIKIL